MKKEMKISDPFEEYFDWLLAYFDADKNLTSLYRYLHFKCYFFAVAEDDHARDMDRNREIDGMIYRQLFLSEYHDEIDGMEEPCSMLEFLLGVVDRYSHLVDDAGDRKRNKWMRMLLMNLGILHYTNDKWNEKARKEVSLATFRLKFRRYDTNGQGGLFPLKYSNRDERKVDIMQQMFAYINENKER